VAIFVIELDDKRLAVAKKFGATTLVNSTDGQAARHVMELTEGAGVDVTIEAVGIPATFDICQAMVAAGGHIANVGVHGKPVELHMEKLWDRKHFAHHTSGGHGHNADATEGRAFGQAAAEQAGNSSLRDERHYEGV
jgi:threonine dehydrogenase-like Zn-dependent dehydrogenase